MAGGHHVGQHRCRPLPTVAGSSTGQAGLGVGFLLSQRASSQGERKNPRSSVTGYTSKPTQPREDIWETNEDSAPRLGNTQIHPRAEHKLLMSPAHTALIWAASEGIECILKTCMMGNFFG